MTISPGFAILVANFTANSLSGMVNSFLLVSLFGSISCMSCLMIDSLFSVSGSSSVAIAISE